MYSPILMQICAFIAMATAITSYFVKDKRVFLVVQSIAIVMFAFSNFFNLIILPVFTYLIAFIRMIVYYAYEKADKPAPFLIKSIFAWLNVVAYFVLNAISGTLFNVVDILVMVASVLYAYSFGIRNLQRLRLYFIIPTGISITYYAMIPDSFFALISYSFELIANLTSFVLYANREKRFNKKKQNN